MAELNPREPIRLSDIDNLLEDSIFNTSNGAKLADYLRKKRGNTGRVRLQNIFEKVAASIPKPMFNFDVDSSDPNPLPESPDQSVAEVNNAGESAAPAPTAGTSTPIQNGNDLIEVVAENPAEPVVTPLIVLNDFKIASPKIAPPNAPSVSNLGRQALLNQYNRTNMAKSELLRQITSTPKPESLSSSGRVTKFDSPTSPITKEGSLTIAEPGRSTPPPLGTQIPDPLVLLQVSTVPVLPVDTVPPPQILAPSTQAPTEVSPRKVIVISTPAGVPDLPSNMIVPETPSPVKDVLESPKVAHQIVPRKLSTTFNSLQQQQANDSDQYITPDNSISGEGKQIGLEECSLENDQPVEQEQPMGHKHTGEQLETENEKEVVPSDRQEEPIDREQTVLSVVTPPQPIAVNSFITKSILKDKFTSSQKKRQTLRVSFSQQLVQQREISPAPSIPEAHYSSSEESSGMSDEEDFEDCEYQVVDEVYSDDGECDPNDIEENYNEFVRNDSLEKQLKEIHERIPSPLINVVDEASVQWYHTSTPRSQQRPDMLLAPETIAKDNKTDLQLVDIITDWDDEDDDEEVEKEDQEPSPVQESPSAPIDIPETQQSTQNPNVTVCSPMDISNLEDSAERLVDLPPPPPVINDSVVENLSSTPDKAITPPTQFNDSAKCRFLRENEDALISRLQSELPPPSQEPPLPPATPERMSETLMEIVQSFRDQPPTSKVTEVTRKTIIPVKKLRTRTSAVDPATNSYFKAVVEAFSNSTVPVPMKTDQLTTAQKRKLYATSNGEGEPQKQNGNVKTSVALRNLQIIVQRLKVDTYFEKMTDSDRAALQKTNLKPQEVQPDSAGAISPEKVTEAGPNAPEVSQQEENLEQLDKNGSEPITEIPEPAFAGFDESTDLIRHPDIMRNAAVEDTITSPSSSEDQMLDGGRNPETELNQMQLAPSNPELEGKRVLRKKINTDTKESSKSVKAPILKTAAAKKNSNEINKKGKQNPIVQLESKRLTRKAKNQQVEKSPESGSVEEKIVDPDERLTPINERASPVGEVDGKRMTRKAKNQQVEKSTESGSVEEKIVDPDERLTPINERASPVGEVEGKRMTRKAKNQQVEKSTESGSVEEKIIDPDEGLTPINEQDPPVRTVKGKKAGKPKKSSKKNDNREGNVEASIPEGISTESEEERLTLQTPLVVLDAPPPQANPKRRGRQPLSKNKKTAQTAAIDTEPKENSKKVVEQSSEPNSVEAGEHSSSATLSMVSPMPDKSTEDSAQSSESLPLKKRKERIVCVQEPPSSELFEEATNIEINNDEPLLLEPANPVPNKSKKRKEQRTRDYHEKYTTEKSEKKLPKMYQDIDDENDVWLPSKKSLKNRFNRKLRKEVDSVATHRKGQRALRQAEPTPTEEVRRSNRKRRLADHVVKRNPNLKSIYETPNYRQLTDEEFVELTLAANKREEENKKKRAPKPKNVSSDSTNMVARESRKRTQEDLSEPTTSKRNRSDDVTSPIVVEQPSTVDPSPSTTDADKSLSTEQMQAYSWMLKLMNTNGVQCTGQDNTGLIVGGQYMHYSQEHLSFRERNGIQYSFYLHSDTENYGFLRFAPSTVKKLTKTEKFILKFLILEGNLSIQLNGQKIQAKGGDFLMLPEYSTYAIENGENVSLIFMIKLCPSLCEI